MRIAWPIKTSAIAEQNHSLRTVRRYLAESNRFPIQPATGYVLHLTMGTGYVLHLTMGTGYMLHLTIGTGYVIYLIIGTGTYCT